MSDLPEYILDRVFDAPREMVWRAWTDPEFLPRWYGPGARSWGTAPGVALQPGPRITLPARVPTGDMPQPSYASSGSRIFTRMRRKQLRLLPVVWNAEVVRGCSVPARIQHGRDQAVGSGFVGLA